ncbi:Lrp/AsnC family transcriptional regulator [Nocardia yamanashiensis]|uniref:Lrp/AsnC family transcriptional regulator n=1 Tax=Nocardia yamanashiensis TaxID=209247 RepID=UPI001E2963DD|nr:Lrp/AsnC family transcriptional regulator [Nocardia yamanashiensis]UGT42382.1 Lrp/AsnC family transcriptional regulator [Nocardia yamanashiensis]
MVGEAVENSAIMDLLDKQIVHGLVTDARISFARLGSILGVSEQTVARRYRSLRQRGIIHVSGQVNMTPLGHARWLLRIRTTPSRAVALAESLARVPDLSWVSLLSTGFEVTCVGRPRSIERRDELLLRLVPNAGQVQSMNIYEVMRAFPFAEEWPRYGRLLSAEQLRELGPRRSAREPGGPDAPVALSREDEAMLALLARDGRAPYAQIADVTGWSANRAARRMNELTEAGVLYFDLDFALERMGFQTRGMLWLRVRPAHLEAVGLAVSRHQEVAFVAATTGIANMIVSVECVDIAHLYRYVTDALGPLEGIEDIEVSLALRMFKQQQTLLTSKRIAVGR